MNDDNNTTADLGDELADIIPTAILVVGVIISVAIPVLMPKWAAAVTLAAIAWLLA